ncbi:crotonase/enoyl-CoA hydratase family protein [Maritimibacter fusiformis]|uniref:Crotonase/enoyl-CoA hydratase family protein n=1 Tax=Maritimibacter fusiformis TaxID=2603819 RepID=A0A5D0RJ56_9RHOB|nr:crotonase/enoyl-CoA hydratase family protein [Maritimibacter fusiformis]TYB80936.1 crotonase/enoyl-CoA hydratase family protein [Maritimibacter fusiformis]
MSDRVTISRDGPVATVTMNRPDKLNALDVTQIEAIVAAGASLATARDVRAVVLTGAGGSFCAGLDIAAMPVIAELARSTGFMTRSHGRSNLFQAAAMTWAELPQPVIAAVEGHAYGGGFQIMLGADIRVAAPSAKFAIMEAKWGLVPDMGGMVLARRLLRGDVLRRLTYTAEVFDAEGALDWGVVTELADDPLARAQALAAMIASRSPDAVRAAKRLISDTEVMGAGDVLLEESAAQEALVGQPNQLEAVMAGFEKREPKFTD